MSYSSQTPYLGLPQYVPGDNPNAFDWNAAYRKMDTIAQPLKMSNVYLANLAALEAAYPTGDGEYAHVAGDKIYRYIDGAWRSIGVDLAGYYTKTEIGAVVDEINTKVIPAGGTTGQVLKKASGDDYEVAWDDSGVALPAGGTVGQFLRKSSSTDGDAAWATLMAQALSGVTAAESLSNIAATDTMAQAFGKLMYWFTTAAGGIFAQSTVANVTNTLKAVVYADKTTGSMDDITIPGIYYAASGLTNNPAGAGGLLYVAYSDTYSICVQIFYPGASGESFKAIYKRRFITGAWTAWENILA